MQPAGTDYNLVKSYAMASLLIMACLILFTGWWIDRTIRQQVIYNTSRTAALYVQSFIAPQLQGLKNRFYLTNEEISHLEHLLSDTPLGRKIRSVKIWSLDGQLLHHPNREMIGRRFEPTPNLLVAAAGRIGAEFDEVGPGEDSEEAKLGMPLLEIYTPIKQLNDGRTIAVAEFYQEADSMARHLEQTRRQAWLVIIATMLIAYSLLYGIVRRGGRIIRSQDHALHQQVVQLTELLDRNRSLSSQLRRTMGSNTENSEKLLSRLSADLHDGPAQYMGLALLRLDELSHSKPEERQVITEELRGALNDSLTELRNISKGLALPNLESMSLEGVVVSAVKAHRQRTASEVELRTAISDASLQVAMPLKITLFRSIQESLNNAYRHANGIGQQVSVRQQDGELEIVVGDQGPGFDYTALPATGDNLGLAGLRERIKGMGGRFRVHSRIGKGTTLNIQLPLKEDD